MEACGEKHFGKGFCKKHHRAFAKWGDPLHVGVNKTRITSEQQQKRWENPEYRQKHTDRMMGRNNPGFKGAKVTLMCATCGEVFTAYPNYKGTERKFCSHKCAVECPERMEKIRRANIGKKASPQTIQKLIDSHKGKFRGPDSPSWKGGVSLIGQKLRGSTAYAEWRQAVFERDDYTCQLCNTRGGKLQADHYPYPFAKFPEKRLDLENGRTLCRPCHHHVTYVTKEWRSA